MLTRTPLGLHSIAHVRLSASILASADATRDWSAIPLYWIAALMLTIDPQ